MTPWTVAHNPPGYSHLAPWDFSKQEYWNGLLFGSPGVLPDPEIEPRSPALRANSLPFEPPVKSKAYLSLNIQNALNMFYHVHELPISNKHIHDF